MAEAFFDIVVVGTNLAGLAYAALCAKQGYTVLIIGQDCKPATYPVGNALMHRSIPLFYGFSSSLPIRSFFRDLGLIAEMRNRPARLEPYLQIITPGGRIDLCESRPSTVENLDRAFPGKGEELFRFLQDALRQGKGMDELLDELPPVPPKGFWEKYKLKRYLRRHPVHDEALEPLPFPAELRFSTPATAVVLFLSRLHGRPLSPFVARRMLQHVTGGFFEFPQGVDGMKRLFTERVLSNGGAYWPERVASQVLMKKKAADSIVVQRPRRTVGFRLLIGNCGPRHFLSLVPQEQQDVRFHGNVKALKPAYYNYVVNFAVQPDVIPEQMARNMVISMLPKQEVGGPNTLWVYTQLPEDPEGDRPATLVASARLEASRLPLDRAGFDQLNQSILHTLEWVLPFLREKLVKTHTPYLTIDRETNEEKLDPTELQEIYDSPLDGSLDLAAIPVCTGYRNMLLLGDHAMGALGFEGSIISARQAFAWTVKNVVLKKIIKK